MFVRLFYSSISFMQIQIVGIADLPRYAVVREHDVLLKLAESRDARHLGIGRSISIVW
jgi:hypothetical protein